MTAPIPTSPNQTSGGLLGSVLGANGILSYAGGGAGAATSADVRVRKIEHSWESIYTESHGRIHRAMYPHQRAPSRFAVTLELKGYAEQKPFMDFMFAYIQSFVGDFNNGMFVSVPARNFQRWGIPVEGVFQGDWVGSMVFAPTIVFETLHDPQDPTILTGADPNVSQVGSPGSGEQAQFFYPFSAGSISPNTQASSLYDFSNGTNFGASVASGISGVLDTIVGNVGAAADAAQRIIDNQQRAGG